jgi:hypothetical protein
VWSVLKLDNWFERGEVLISNECLIDAIFLRA